MFRAVSCNVEVHRCGMAWGGTRALFTQHGGQESLNEYTHLVASEVETWVDVRGELEGVWLTRTSAGEPVSISKKDLCHLSAMLGIICLITSILANFANLVNLYISVLIQI